MKILELLNEATREEKGPIGIELSKEICKKAAAAKTKTVTINAYRDIDGKWKNTKYSIFKVISNTACIAAVEIGTGIKHKLYGPELYVVGHKSISINQPLHPTIKNQWMKRYNDEFKEYQEYLKPAPKKS